MKMKIRKILFWGGRLIYGHNVASSLLLGFLIVAPAIAFCIQTYYIAIGHQIEDDQHTASWYAVLLLIGLVLIILDVIFLVLTSTRDPGIVPRNSKPPCIEEPIVDENNSPSSRGEWMDRRRSCDVKLIPQVKYVIVNGEEVEVKYCETCLVYRPPRTYHCFLCDVCVQRFDHHCKWLGQCIGLLNYRFYYMFVVTTTILCIYIIMVSWMKIILRYKSVLEGISRDILSDILIIYCFVFVWFVGSLSVFHFYLIATNQTSYENFLYHDRKDNPYNKGITKNFKQVFFAKTHHHQ